MTKIAYSVLALCLLLFSCSSNRNDYKISMTEDYMETSFSLWNGIQIDELSVATFSKDNTPYEFYLKQSVMLQRKPNLSSQNGLKNLIFFNKPNNDYYWRNDSTWGIFNIDIVKYKYRGYLSNKDRFDYSYQKQDSVFPSVFKPDTWYLIDFRPADVGAVHHEFMYVDSDKRFTFYKLKEIGEKG